MNYFDDSEIRLGDKLTVGRIGFGGSKAVADDFGLIHYAEAAYELLFVARAECA